MCISVPQPEDVWVTGDKTLLILKTRNYTGVFGSTPRLYFLGERRLGESRNQYGYFGKHTEFQGIELLTSTILSTV